LFFERAAQLGGNEEHLLDGFLAPRPGDPEPAVANRPAKPDAGRAGDDKAPAPRPGRADL
jgi:hypothetical protein